MLKIRKESIVEELAERLRTADTLIVADYRGLTHAELDDVRTQLLAHGARFTVVKNTLTRRAAQAAETEALLEFLTGPTAIAFVHDGDMVAVAKTLDDTAKATRRLALKGGILDGRPIDASAVQNLASLPPVEILRGQVLGAIVAPLTSLVGLVSAPLQNLVGLLNARIDQLGGAGDAEAPAPPADAQAPAEEAEPASEPEASAEAGDDAEAAEPADEPEAAPPVEEGETAAVEETPDPPADEPTENDEQQGE